MAISYKVNSNNCIFKFSKNNPCAASVSSGSIVEFETLDCYANQFKSEKDSLESIDWQRVNPATGPVFVEGAEPGDVLKVTVEKIRVANRGIMAACEGEVHSGIYTKAGMPGYFPSKVTNLFLIPSFPFR